jgi:hypothetical protein
VTFCPLAKSPLRNSRVGFRASEFLNLSSLQHRTLTSLTLLAWLMSPLLLSRNCRTSLFPCRAAHERALSPALSTAARLAPLAARISMASLLPLPAATCTRASPSELSCSSKSGAADVMSAVKADVLASSRAQKRDERLRV